MIVLFHRNPGLIVCSFSSKPSFRPIRDWCSYWASLFSRTSRKSMSVFHVYLDSRLESSWILNYSERETSDGMPKLISQNCGYPVIDLISDRKWFRPIVFLAMSGSSNSQISFVELTVSGRRIWNEIEKSRLVSSVSRKLIFNTCLITLGSWPYSIHRIIAGLAQLSSSLPTIQSVLKVNRQTIFVRNKVNWRAPENQSS